MIIVKLSGGLGNQLFQYALGRSMAEREKTIFKIDLYSCKKQINITPRQYELSPFNVQENFSTPQENEIFCGGKFNIFLRKVLNKVQFNFYLNNNIIEKKYNFNSSVLNLKGSCYLDGYWQTEKYFFDIKNIIKSEFTLKEKYNNLNVQLVEKIVNCNSVSIHIRRGDYISDQKINNYHGVCSLDYYHKAINLISKKYSDLTFFIFSDDLKWCKKNLKINWPVVFIEGNKNYEDLILMSKCHHNIIANSSFSWWGAWLNNNPDKIVIAPKQWFVNKSINTEDLIPESWIKI